MIWSGSSGSLRRMLLTETKRGQSKIPGACSSCGPFVTREPDGLNWGQRARFGRSRWRPRLGYPRAVKWHGRPARVFQQEPALWQTGKLTGAALAEFSGHALRRFLPCRAAFISFCSLQP